MNETLKKVLVAVIALILVGGAIWLYNSQEPAQDYERDLDQAEAVAPQEPQEESAFVEQAESSSPVSNPLKDAYVNPFE